MINLKRDKFINFGRHRKDMTLIIGARCKDGVVIIADRRVIEGTDTTTHNKITRLPLNIFVAGAGVGELIDKFNERIPFLLEENRQKNFEKLKKTNPKIDIINVPFYLRTFDFLEDCEGLLFDLNEVYIRQNYDMHISILVGLIVDNKAELHYLDTIATLDSKRKTYKTIGSGSPYADFLLKKLWNENLTMKEMAKIGKFIINYIAESEIDNNVGNGVQIAFMPDIPINPQEQMLTEDLSKFLPYEDNLEKFDDAILKKKFNLLFQDLLKELKK